MTEDELAAIEARAKAATRGPWEWIQDRMNDRVARRTRTGGRQAKPGHRLHDMWVYLLVGPPYAGVAEDWRDAWDYPHVCGLHWSALRATSVTGFPSKEDEAFIAHAREDVPALIAEVRRLRAMLDDVKGATIGDAELVQNLGLDPDAEPLEIIDPE